MSVLIFFIILISLVLVHEFGHFIVAKKSGIRVDEFGVGFPPKLYSKKFGETEYSINLLPLGGFVKIFGETPDQDSLGGADKERSMVNKSKKVQGAVLLAGIFMNFLFAWPLLTATLLIGMPSSVDSAPAGATVQGAVLTVTEIFPGSPAEKAGLKLGDKIFSVSDSKIPQERVENPTPETFSKFVSEHGERELVISTVRGGDARTIAATPVNGIITDMPKKAAIGVALDTVGVVKLPLHLAVYEGGKLTLLFIRDTFVGLYGFFGKIFQGQGDIEQVSGPVGIVSIVSDASTLGFSYLLVLAALISINLGVINLLPIPALDGGRFLFLIIEAIKGSPVKPKIANTAHAVGFVLLIALILFVTYHDILKLVMK